MMTMLTIIMTVPHLLALMSMVDPLAIGWKSVHCVGIPLAHCLVGGVLASNITTLPGAEVSKGDVVPQHLIPSRISKITQLTLDQFDNNYRLFAQKLKKKYSDLTIRVILLKNNIMFLNYTFKILVSSNVLEATLASTHKVCTILLEHITRGDTLLCLLEAGYICV